ncbi:MAG: efflux RND transporter periplasmic adaptor subunit, partial [Oscillospiraceae bacterium]|nr:efflux RND transporter periplasmic adaptor subunit [Oscillospiraceae bacterium]
MLIKILCGAAVPCLLLGLCACKKEVRQHKERAVRVMVQQPQKRIFREQIPVQGTVKSVEYATISAKSSGTLEMLNVSEGDKRKTGDVLFGIDRHANAYDVRWAKYIIDFDRKMFDRLQEQYGDYEGFMWEGLEKLSTEDRNPFRKT